MANFEDEDEVGAAADELAELAGLSRPGALFIVSWTSWPVSSQMYSST